LVLNILLIITFIQVRVWRRKRGEFWVDEMSRITYATAAGVGLMSMIAFFVQPEPFSRLMLVWVFLAIVLLVGVARLVRRTLLSALYQRGILADQVLVVGSGEVGRSLIRTLLARPDLGYQAIGYLHDGLSENNIGLGRIPNLGTFADLPWMVAKRPQLNTVFIALPGEMHQQISHMLQVCQQHGVAAQVVPDLLQLSMNRVEFNNMAGIPTLGIREVGISQAQQVSQAAAGPDCGAGGRHSGAAGDGHHCRGDQAGLPRPGALQGDASGQKRPSLPNGQVSLHGGGCRPTQRGTQAV
jgi:FlaA1/EpsC-like NDP-sugar epimerase